MAHFAEIDSLNKVIRVLVVDNSIQDGAAYLTELLGGLWVQTSYNTHGGVHYAPNSNPPVPDGEPQIGYNYACVGYNYDPIANAFYDIQPYPSWVLNTSTYYWEAPTPPGPAPEAVFPNVYAWDEATVSWILTIWQPPTT